MPLISSLFVGWQYSVLPDAHHVLAALLGPLGAQILLHPFYGLQTALLVTTGSVSKHCFVFLFTCMFV